MPKLAAGYGKNVFINCPFDSTYKPLFSAMVFAVFECGLRPRCALEVEDSGEVRITKIERIIRECRWGIHDISCTELNTNGLPRFNMPLELGIFMGARRFGDAQQKKKACLILDADPYRYQEFMSDIAGQDIRAHGKDASRAIKAVRAWLGASPIDVDLVPGASVIIRRFNKFTAELPAICANTERDMDELTFTEFADIASLWLTEELAK